MPRTPATTEATAQIAARFAYWRTKLALEAGGATPATEDAAWDRVFADVQARALALQALSIPAPVPAPDRH